MEGHNLRMSGEGLQGEKMYGSTEDDEGPCDWLAYRSANIIQAIKLKRTILMGHIRDAKFLENNILETRREERRWKTCVVGAIIILKQIVGFFLTHSHRSPSPLCILSQINLVHVPHLILKYRG
jgi:hypothetical protein